MSHFLQGLVSLCADVIMLNAVYRMFGIFFDRSSVDRRTEYFAYGCCWLVNNLNSLFLGIPVINALVSMATLLGLTALYPGKPLGKLAHGLILFCLTALCEILTYSLMVIFQVPQYAMMLVGTPLSKLMLLFISLILKQKYTPQVSPQISRLYWVAILALPCGTTFLLLILCREYESLSGEIILVIAGVLFALNLLAFSVLDSLEKYSAAFHEKELLLQQNRAYQVEFNLMRQSERQVSALRHDMKNHLAVLREYAVQGRLDKLEEYLNTFSQKLNCPGFVHTGNPDIDSILNYKLGQAVQAGAKLKLNLKLPENFTANPFDLNVILGNLLDNAAEALAKSQDKQLSLSLQVERGIFYLRLSNSYDGVAARAAGSVSCSHKRGEGHGMGLSAVRHTVDKYHGELRIDRTGTVFAAEVVLYLDE